MSHFSYASTPNYTSSPILTNVSNDYYHQSIPNDNILYSSNVSATSNNAGGSYFSAKVSPNLTNAAINTNQGFHIPSNNNMGSPLSIASATSSIVSSTSNSSSGSYSSRNQYFCSKGFDFEDDFEFVPDLLMKPQPQQQQQNHHHVSSNSVSNYDYDYYYSHSPDSSYGSIPSQQQQQQHHQQYKFNPYKSVTFSPKTSPNKLNTESPKTTHSSLNGNIAGTPRVKKVIEIVNPNTGMRVDGIITK
ncbi:hypothetical protein DASC09_062610 [Saccharomycopsis crataegensis]|uniref:Uncharacterized protein n=1 Tax=Saccharomycopsis crataegensis TaxID=43959 RepID=A0AAV5QVJ8_9ASCO|nr:hypothetical protein DASC09_062610 [Saccharomycopsis crataegensis]